MPPIQIAAPAMCSALAAISRALSSSRAAAWVVSTAATTMTAQSGSSRRGPDRPANRPTARARAAAALSKPASMKSAPMRLDTGRSSVPDSTAPCMDSDTASHATKASALQPPIAAVRRAIAAPWPRRAANGRASITRNSALPMATLCAAITSPCRTMLR